MKLIAFLFLLLLGFTSNAQPPAKANAVQGVTLQLGNIAVVERVSTNETNNSSGSEVSKINVHSFEKWMVNAKEIIESEKISEINSLTALTGNSMNKPFISTQLYTLSKP